jgi:hypothetical protein
VSKTETNVRLVCPSCTSIGCDEYRANRAMGTNRLKGRLRFMIKTFEEAYHFVLEQKVCSVFGSKGSPYPSLWDSTGLSEEKPKAGGWSPKVMAVWDWKTRIPQTHPEAVFYGKIPGGDAVLMEMEHFRTVQYPAAFVPVSELDSLSQNVYELIRLEPSFTGPLRKRAIARLGCTKSRFDTALKKLQISLNIVRSNDPTLKNDFWLTMREVHLDIVQKYEY